MDWYVVEYLYPDAFEEFKNKMFPNMGVLSLSTIECYDVKKLFGFFDREGIYLNIEMFTTHHWGFTILLHGGIVLCPPQEHRKNRESIECDGFMECFRMLQLKINNKL